MKLPSVTEQEASFLVQNSVGDVFISPQVSDQPLNDQDRLVFASAIQKALQYAIQSSSTNGNTTDVPFRRSRRRRMKNQNDVTITNEEESNNYKSFLQLLNGDGSVPVIPDTCLTSFSWDTSVSSSVIKNFIQNVRPELLSSSSVSISHNQLIIENNPIPTTITSTKPSSSSTLKSGMLDMVILGAQQEAAASAVLKDVRSAHGRMRKSSTPFRSGQTPVWALITHRGGKLKPEAAAEMARARMAAATAAAVMRDHNSETLSQSKSTPIFTKTTNKEQFHRKSLPGLFDSIEDLEHESNQDFLNEYISPEYRTHHRSISDVIQKRHHHHHHHQLSRPSSVEIHTPHAKGIEKKSVSFVQGTIFHMKK